MSDQVLLLTVIVCSLPSAALLIGLLVWPSPIENLITVDDEPAACREYDPEPDIRVLTMRELAAVIQRNTDTDRP